MTLNLILTWLLVLGFLGAGTFNAIGARGVRDDFVRWGYPAWWCHVTGGVEIATALLISFPTTRSMGLALGGVIVGIATATVLKARELSHLVPLAVFAVLLASAVATLAE